MTSDSRAPTSQVLQGRAPRRLGRELLRAGRGRRQFQGRAAINAVIAFFRRQTCSPFRQKPAIAWL